MQASYIRRCRILAIILTLTCAACGGTPYVAQSRTVTTDLSGQWQLTDQSVAELTAWVKGLADKKERQIRRDARRERDDETFLLPPHEGSGEGSGANAAGQFSNAQWLRAQDHKEVAALLEWIVPAAQIDIKQSDGELEIRAGAGQGRRRFVASESSTLFLAVDTFKVNSGWLNDSYVIRSRGTENGIQLIESYSLRSGSQKLEEQIEASIPMIGKRKFTFVYQRR